ncbi:hypothetical protein Vretifemale_7954, partial [Volvox reticuliferus]
MLITVVSRKLGAIFFTSRATVPYARLLTVRGEALEGLASAAMSGRLGVAVEESTAAVASCRPPSCSSTFETTSVESPTALPTAGVPTVTGDSHSSGIGRPLQSSASPSVLRDGVTCPSLSA